MTLQQPIMAAAPVASFLISVLMARWLAARAVAGVGPMDLPNERSLHTQPIPRTGGLAVLTGLLLPLLVMVALGLRAEALIWIGSALALVGLVSFRDDLGHVAASLRFLIQVAAAVLLAIGGLAWSSLDLPGASLLIPSFLAGAGTILYVVWMTNLYNFMDGMDGFASGMAVFGFGAFAILGWIGGEPLFALASACVAAAAAGFLFVNFPPARIFLGDVGSSSLGLLAAAFALWGVHLSLFPLWTAWLAFSPFIVDATWTLIARLLRRERPWEPHRSHHYQRLVLAGWGHRKTVLRSYVVMAAAAATAVASPRLPQPEQVFLLLAWAALYLVLHFKVGLVERAAAERAAVPAVADEP